MDGRTCSLKDSVEAKDAELDTLQIQLKETFANVVADVSMLKPVAEKNFAMLGDDSSFETTYDILKVVLLL